MSNELRVKEKKIISFYNSKTHNYIYPYHNYKIIKKFKQEKFPFLITHDIDQLDKKNLLGRFKKIKSNDASFSKKFRLIGSLLFHTFIKNNWTTVEELLEFHEREKNSATFFFMSDVVKNRSVYDGYYPLKKVNPSDFNDHSIGIHFLKNAVINNSSFCIEKFRLENRFNRNINYSRSHHFFFDKIKTPVILEKNQIKLDFSMGWNFTVGYRPELKELNNRISINKVIYVPTQIQDTVLYRHKTANIFHVKKIIEYCKYSGLPLVFLWHNCWPRKGNIEKKIIELIKYIQNNGGITMSADEYFEWIKS